MAIATDQGQAIGFLEDVWDYTKVGLKGAAGAVAQKLSGNGGGTPVSTQVYMPPPAPAPKGFLETTEGKVIALLVAYMLMKGK